jgi:SNF2 family DNA or RNA helicase
MQQWLILSVVKCFLLYSSLMSLMMQLRKVTNHPYLVSSEAEPQWEAIRRAEAEEDASLVRKGLKPVARPSIEQRAGEALVASSGKLVVLDKLLTKLKAQGHRVLLFSLFTRVLDLLEDYFSWKGMRYLRLDGSTNRVRRGVDIRRFNAPNSPFFIYLISTRAGGLGINLTGADTVIHFDSDFNPQQDLQAQDRCHRIGQVSGNW